MGLRGLSATRLACIAMGSDMTAEAVMRWLGETRADMLAIGLSGADVERGVREVMMAAAMRATGMG